MGIPGLTGLARKYEVAHEPEYLHRGWFYVDGLNFVHGIAGALPKEKKDSPYAEFVKRAQRKIRSITRLRPSKLTFYFDGMLPEEKVSIRQQRVTQKLGTVHRRQVIFAHDLLIYILTEKFPFIDIVFTGMEAEDEIANEIYSARSGPAAKYRHVIFSSDSDVYTFLLPNASNVEVVPLDSLKDQTSLVSVNLGTVHANNVVPRKYRKEMPLPRLGIRLANASNVPRRLLEFINTGMIFKQFIIYLPLIYSPEVPEPFEVGVHIRRALYGLILRRNFNEEFHKITEYGQNDLQLGTTVLEPMVGHELDQTMSVLTKVSLDRIVTNQLEEVASKFELDPNHIEAVGKYVKDLLAGQSITKANELHPQVTKLDSLLRAALVCMHFFNGTVFPDYSKMSCFSLIWRIAPYELSSYL